jgi:hypothetical protein
VRNESAARAGGGVRPAARIVARTVASVRCFSAGDHPAIAVRKVGVTTACMESSIHSVFGEVGAGESSALYLSGTRGSTRT